VATGFVVGDIGGVIADWLSEVAGFGLSLEQPAAIEQTIKAAANTSVLVVLSKLILPQATESRVAGVLENLAARTALLRIALRNRLIRVMRGHLLLRSSTRDDAGECPTYKALILLGLEKLDLPAVVAS
jgi:hypothetical protein